MKEKPSILIHTNGNIDKENLLSISKETLKALIHNSNLFCSNYLIEKIKTQLTPQELQEFLKRNPEVIDLFLETKKLKLNEEIFV